MVRTLNFFMLLCLATSLVAQSQTRKPKNMRFSPETKIAMPLKETAFTGFENGPANATEISVPPSQSRGFESAAGITTYDLQSNQGIGTRLHNHGGGVVSSFWTISKTGSEAAGYGDRGSGYNKSQADGTFANLTEARVEAVRTGFVSPAVLANGKECVFTHLSPSTGQYRIHWACKAASSTTWTEGDIPTTTPNGGLWCRVAVGGPDGNTIHVIYLTTITGTNFGGVVVDGMNGTLRYSRSTDGGATWDIVDAALPGLAAPDFSGLAPEGYAIDANGSTVAITIFDSWDDIIMWKSSDNGATWAQGRVVNDLPVTAYDTDEGYTFNDVSVYYDSTYYPDSLAMFSCDGSGQVFVDKGGGVHVFYAALFISDIELGDAQTNYYPFMNLGIVYWNESMADNAGLYVGNSPDVNGDGTWGDANPVTDPQVYHWTTGYGDAFVTGPQAGMDANNVFYVTYVTDHEAFFNTTEGWHYKRPFVVKSKPGDYTVWSEPVGIIDVETVSDTTIAAFWECYFPAMGKRVDDCTPIMFQQDFTPGITLRTTDPDEPEENSLVYICFPTSKIPDPVVGTNEQVPTLQFAMSPNPASDFARLTFNLEKDADLVIEVFNNIGSKVNSQRLSAGAGERTVDVSLANCTPGLHYIRISDGRSFGTKKVFVAKQ